MKEYSFEKLDVWKLSTEFALKVYQITKQFPASERYGMTNQLRRAAVCDTQ
ncbi:MAG: four helix bundle protein [Candidatus Marinimicrobia bacterium]|nr:four helix bundle protein [Candidatus Neomarinimicrobiota bacterium]